MNYVIHSLTVTEQVIYWDKNISNEGGKLKFYFED